jgi:hypothetical protein
MKKPSKPKKFVPYDKRSKAKKAETNQESRADWGGVNPVTRRFRNEKDYDRNKKRDAINDELTNLEDYEQNS